MRLSWPMSKLSSSLDEISPGYAGLDYAVCTPQELLEE